MNDKILDSLNEKYGLVLTDSGETNEKAQKMTEINKLRFQNITYKSFSAIYAREDGFHERIIIRS